MMKQLNQTTSKCSHICYSQLHHKEMCLLQFGTLEPVSVQFWHERLGNKVKDMIKYFTLEDNDLTSKTRPKKKNFELRYDLIPYLKGT